MPKSPAEIELLEHQALLIPHTGHKVQHDLRRVLKGIDVENLRADMAVDAPQAKAVLPDRRAHRLHGLSIFERKAEFAVNLPGADKAVGMRVNPRLDAKQNIGGLVPTPGLLTQPVELVWVIHDDAADPLLQGIGQLLGRFVIAVKAQKLRVNPSAKGGSQFAAGHHVHAQPLLLDDLGHGKAGKGLAGIPGTGPCRRNISQ